MKRIKKKMKEPFSDVISILYFNKHAQIQHVETRHWKSNIASKSAPNGGIAEKNIISRAIWNTTWERLWSEKDNESS